MSRWKKKRPEPPPRRRRTDWGLAAAAILISSIAAFLGYGLFTKGDLVWRTGPQNGYGLTTLSVFFGVSALGALGSLWATYTEWRDSTGEQAERPRKKWRSYWR